MDVTSYLLGKKSSGGGGGGGDTRWQEIGYEEEPQVIQDGIDYAKEIMQNWDASITDRQQAFYGDKNLIYFPLVDTSTVTNGDYMFQNCTGVEIIPDLDLTSCTSCKYMLQNCTALIEVGDIKFNGYCNTKDMFNGCTALKTIKTLYIGGNSSSDSITISTLPQLTTIETIKTNNLKSYDRTLINNCPNLSNNTLKVILNFLKTLTNQSYKTLSRIGLSQTQAELCATFDEWAELESAGWTTGY